MLLILYECIKLELTRALLLLILRFWLFIQWVYFRFYRLFSEALPIQLISNFRATQLGTDKFALTIYHKHFQYPIYYHKSFKYLVPELFRLFWAGTKMSPLILVHGTKAHCKMWCIFSWTFLRFYVMIWTFISSITCT